MRTLLRIVAAAILALPVSGVHAQGTSKYQLGIIAPADGSTAFSNTGEVIVRASVVPDLANGDQVELLVDGEPVAPPGTTLDFSLAGVTRGLHQLQVVVLDAAGNAISTSPASTLNVWHASRLYPNRYPDGASGSGAPASLENVARRVGAAPGPGTATAASRRAPR
jgi:hypothetical protein